MSCVSKCTNCSSNQIRIKLRHPSALLPQRSTPDAAGLDLHSCVEMEIPARKNALVPTGISIELPEFSYGRVAPRSGLALKHSLDVGAGVIDRDFRGEIGVIIFNHGDVPYKVQKHERIAQLIVERIFMPEPIVCEDLSDSSRGENGFGSSGKI